MTTLKEEANLKRRIQKKNRTVMKFTITGRLLAEYHSISEAARINNISRTAIQNCLKKESGVKYSGGYIWRYKSDFSKNQLIRLYKEALIDIDHELGNIIEKII